MIRAAGVSKSFVLGPRRVPALRQVDVHIDEPGFYAIMGASGSGKSTLLHLLAGLDRPDEGEIEVAGRNLGALSEAELTAYRRDVIGIVFQQFNLISTLTARQNVELPGMLAGRDADWLQQRSDDLLDRMGLRERAEHRPDALSGGEQQRVAIARALLFEPQVIFADEPTGNLDSQTGEQFWEALHEVMAGREAAVLAVTHEPLAAIHCTRAFVLSDGRIVGAFETEGLDVATLSLRYQQLCQST
jgi:putative ABC transport system ATP-binding protein